MTNSEKIKKMNEDEMAKFIDKLRDETNCDCCIHKRGTCGTSSCEIGIKVWLQQEAKPTLSEAERIILENIDKDYKWIARDKDGTLYVCQVEPWKDEGIWQNGDGEVFDFYNHLFQFITWNDEEPYNIEELLKEG